MALIWSCNENCLHLARHRIQIVSNGAVPQGIFSSQASGILTIEVQDNGVGFDPRLLHDDPGTVGGFGMLSVRERLNLFGGSFDVEAAPEKGSRFTMTVPLRPPPP